MNLYMIWLTKVFNFSSFKIKKFLNTISLEDAFCNTSYIDLSNFSSEIKNNFLSDKLKNEAKKEYEYCLNNNIKLVNFSEKNYPVNLLNTSSPALLYYKGNILPEDEISISIVGARRYTEYGKLCTKKFASDLAKNKVTIISGMAYGIDTFSHLYSLDANGRTIAILGSGVDIVYPKENQKLYERIIENGAVISEFPVHTAPASSNFPIRNRIVAGMSLGTLVIEAGQKSGTIITARLAGEFGRNVYVIPGQIFSNNSKGSNSLIKDGARLVTDPNDILTDIYTEVSQIVNSDAQLSLFTQPILTEIESKIYENISLTPIYIDTLIDKLNLPSVEVISTLTSLELNGYIKQLPGQQYVLNIK